MNHIAQEIVFKGKKPTKNQIFKKAYDRVKQGHTLIEIYWGEHGMTLDMNSDRKWYGWGWIKDIAGDTIANEINSKIHADTLSLWNS